MDNAAEVYYRLPIADFRQEPQPRPQLNPSPSPFRLGSRSAQARREGNFSLGQPIPRVKPLNNGLEDPSRSRVPKRRKGLIS